MQHTRPMIAAVTPIWMAMMEHTRPMMAAVTRIIIATMEHTILHGCRHTNQGGSDGAHEALCG